MSAIEPQPKCPSCIESTDCPSKQINNDYHAKTHCMNISKYLAKVMFVSAIWSLLDAQSPAQGFSLLQVVKPTLGESAARSPRMAQNTCISSNADVHKDLRLQDITVTRSSSDRSLLTVTGSIHNRSDRSHYVYYVVTKFIANNISIEQAIVPVNIDIAPGQSQPFTYEILADRLDSIVPGSIKPMVVKDEYR